MWNASLKLGRISGIPIYVHWTFSLLIGYVVYLGISKNMGTHGVIWLLELLLGIFVCVLLHELGHSFAARRYGIGTEDISLLPIGGMARLKEMPREPTQELVIAFMGPMVNIVISLVLFGIFYVAFDGPMDTYLLDPFEGPFDAKKYVFLLFSINFILAVFNLIPAFPMDGGRIFRALLSYKLDYVKATQIASLVGRVAALLMVGLGFYLEDMNLMLLGTYIFFVANMENRMVSQEGALEGYTVNDLLRRRYTVLRMEDKVSDGLSLLFKGLERNFLIMDESNSLEGIVTKKQLLENKDTGSEKSLGEIMRTDIAALETKDALKEVYTLIRQKQQPIVPIFEEGLLMGVIDEGTVNDFIQAKK